jgi:hypothetical protein
MTIQIHGIDHLNIEALSALPDAAPVVIHTIIAIRETYNKLAPTKE